MACFDIVSCFAFVHHPQESDISRAVLTSTVCYTERTKSLMLKFDTFSPRDWCKQDAEEETKEHRLVKEMAADKLRPGANKQSANGAPWHSSLLQTSHYSPNRDQTCPFLLLPASIKAIVIVFLFVFVLFWKKCLGLLGQEMMSEVLSVTKPKHNFPSPQNASGEAELPDMEGCVFWHSSNWNCPNFFQNHEDHERLWHYLHTNTHFPSCHFIRLKQAERSPTITKIIMWMNYSDRWLDY